MPFNNEVSTLLILDASDGSFIKIFDEDPGSRAIIEMNPGNVTPDVIVPARLETLYDGSGRPILNIISPTRNAGIPASIGLLGANGISQEILQLNAHFINLNGVIVDASIAQDVIVQNLKYSAENRSAPRGMMAAPAATSATGTSTPGTGAETKDAVLGDFTFTSQGSSRRYRTRFTGGKISGTAGALVSFTVRDGGNASPTTASPIVCTGAFVLDATGGAGQATLNIDTTQYDYTVGIHKIGVFTTAGVVASVATPVNLRELYVEDVGQI